MLESPEQLKLEESIKIQNLKKQNALQNSISSNSFLRPATSAPKLGMEKKIENLAKPTLTQTTSVTQDGKKRIQPIFLAG